MKKRNLPSYRNKSEQVADALMSRIIEGRLKPGEMLGTEADLLAEHEVSRPTLRESLRMLEAQGVIALSPGSWRRRHRRTAEHRHPRPTPSPSIFTFRACRSAPC